MVIQQVLRFLITVAAVPLCGYYMDGFYVSDITQAVLLGVVLGVLYLLFRPLARLVLSVFNFCTLGLLYIVVDAWLVWTAVGFFRPALMMYNFWWAVAVAVVINALRGVVDVLSGNTGK